LLIDGCLAVAFVIAESPIENTDQALEDELKRKLQQLKTELSNPKENSLIFKELYFPMGDDLIKEFRAMLSI
jgi:hypothetical protein